LKLAFGKDPAWIASSFETSEIEVPDEKRHDAMSIGPEPTATNAPSVVWVPSPNFWHGRKGQPVLAIVLHIMQGTLHGTDAWFQDRKSDVSAHYGVGRNGEIHKYVATSDSAWHAGVVVDPTAPLVLEHPDVNPNLWSIGIEHEGMSGDTLTNAQYAASQWLCQDLVKTFAIPADPKFFIPHHTINAKHAGCPGTGFPLERLLEDLTDQGGV